MAKDNEGRHQKANAKSWFYFTFSGFPIGTKVTFIIRRVHIFGYFVSFYNFLLIIKLVENQIKNL